MKNEKTDKKKAIPQRVINSLLTDVKVNGMNFHQVALFLYHKGWLNTVVGNKEVIRLLYGNISNYLAQCK